MGQTWYCFPTLSTSTTDGLNAPLCPKVLCTCQWEGSACTHERSSFSTQTECGDFFVFFFFFFWVPMCCDHVPNRFSKGSPAVPNTFPIAPQIYPIWFAQSSTFMVYKLKKVSLLIGECICFYFVTGVQRGASIGECPMFQKNWW